MSRQYDFHRNNESSQKDDDNWILQRSAVRSQPAKTLTPQTESTAGDHSGMKLDLMQIPVSNYSANPSPLQALAQRDGETPVQRQEEEKKAENKTGLPDGLKEGIESLSGYDLSGVRVNYNSPKPAQLNAHAYTQGQKNSKSSRRDATPDNPVIFRDLKGQSKTDTKGTKTGTTTDIRDAKKATDTRDTKKDKDSVQRLIRSDNRNQNKKAKPKNKRPLYELQKTRNYGFNDTEIDIGDLKGRFHKGRGGQPCFTSKKGDYDKAVVKSDYDSLIQELKGDPEQEAQLAKEMLEGTTFTTDNSKTKRAAATMVMLTQFIEPHSTRHASADKFARASFRRIMDKKSTFKAEFNRTSGNYVPARAAQGKKRKLSGYGGQESMRAFLKKPKLKTDKATQEDIMNDEIKATLNYLSESSEEED